MKSIPIIHIIGLPGAGKTTLARRLSKVLKIPILRIGYHRARFPQAPIGEADAWIALFRELSRLPFEQIFTIKLDASRKTLAARIRKKKKQDQGGRWFYGAEYRNKYEFVRKLFKRFRKIPADCHINTNRLTKIAVYQQALREIDFIGSV